MHLFTLLFGRPSDRELLEQLALQKVCACQYYDLADYLEVTSDQELLYIINNDFYCELCGLRGGEL